MAELTHNCPHCGKKLTRPEAAFCPNCGAPLKGAEAETAATVHGGSLAKIIVHIPGEESREEFLTTGVATVGRRGSNTIQVLSPIVSGEHARLELTRQGHTITDLNVTLSRSGDVAWFSCMLDDMNTWKGQPANWENTRWTGVLEKRDGRWVLVQQHFSFASG